MREILFRGKRLDNCTWAEGSLSMEYFRECGCVMISPTSDTCYKVEPETVGQFTGLTDKNGKKIFEGDICRVSRPCVIAYGHIEFKNGCFWFVDHGPGGMLRMCDIKNNGFTIEVVGNIHDNPELLEGTDGT